MKNAVRIFVAASVVYTLMVSCFLYGAMWGRVPNDSAIFIAISAFPSSMVTASATYPFREDAANFLQLPHDDRFAMVYDSISVWIAGCVQYGTLAVIAWLLWLRFKKTRQSSLGGNPRDTVHESRPRFFYGNP